MELNRRKKWTVKDNKEERKVSFDDEFKKPVEMKSEV
jgi:hypothetical protein